MKTIVVVLACLLTLVLAGCGGGGGSSNSIKVNGSVSGGQHDVTVTMVSVFEQGHVGEADHLLACSRGPNTYTRTIPFEVRIPNPGIYDFQVSYTYWIEMTDRQAQGDTAFTNIQVNAPRTNVGTLDLELAPPF